GAVRESELEGAAFAGQGLVGLPDIGVLLARRIVCEPGRARGRGLDVILRVAGVAGLTHELGIAGSEDGEPQVAAESELDRDRRSRLGAVHYVVVRPRVVHRLQEPGEGEERDLALEGAHVDAAAADA